MQIQELEKIKYFKNEKLQKLIKLKNQGFCNINYKLESSKNSYLVRVFQSNATVNVSRKFEYKIQKKAWKLNIAPKPLFINSKKTYMITEFYEGIHKTTLKKKELKKLIKIIKKYHNIKIDQKPYDFTIGLEHYSNVLKKSSSKNMIKESYNILEKLKNYKDFYVTTHHDLNPKNILFHKNKIKVIDWEYVGLNSCFFDLASLCSEFNLSEKRKKLILKYYFKKVKKDYIKSLNLYIKLYDNLCTLWFETLK